MFFSVKELHASSYGRSTLKETARVLREAKRRIVARDVETYFENGYLTKWTRPWHVVPKLINFAPAAGDYGVGIEIEMGFNSTADAAFIADKCKNWRYVAIDREGGRYPIEMTLPPVEYSRLSNRSQVARYTKLLNTESSRLYRHETSDLVGTHVNVSVDAQRQLVINRDALRNRLDNIRLCILSMTSSDLDRFFGRRPYSYGHVTTSRSVGNQSYAKFIEWKLFNSTDDYEAVKGYINVAVALTDLAYRPDVPIVDATVRAALQYGVSKRGFGKWTSLYPAVPTVVAQRAARNTSATANDLAFF